jgi:voltage-gated potassium channel
MPAKKKLIFAVLVFLALLFSGICGYMLIEDWNFLDSVYMTIITLSTVGYGEVRHIGTAGRIFTIILILFSVFTIAYIVRLVAETTIQGEIKSIFGRRKLDKKIKSMKDHYIVCGYGRLGRIICKELLRQPIPFVVIENDDQAMEQLEQDKLPYIYLDATEEEALIESGIERAKGLVSVVSSDPKNVYISLTARGLNPKLYIISRAEDEGTEGKLIQAGANKVILPYMIGGIRMAQAIIRPTVSDFFELAIHDHSFELNIEEVTVGEGSSLNNLTLIDSGIRREMDIIIIGIKQKDGNMVFNPSSQTKIQSGDILIAMGRNKDLEKLRKILLATSKK